MAENGTDWMALWNLLMAFPNTPGALPLYQAKEPLTGFLGPQRTAQGDPATWMHMGVNIQGLEWLVPLLTPNQSDDDIRALLSGKPLSHEQRARIEMRAIEFAELYEKKHPGTFAKQPSVVEAEREAMGPGKEMLVPDLPEP